MAGLKKKRRIKLVIIGFVLIAVASMLIGYALNWGGGVNFFRSPTEVAETTPSPTEVFRIGGLVEEGTLVRRGETISFAVTDGGASVPVVFTGILPDLFSEGTGMIATGTLVNGTFQATEILAKHDENYMPKEVVDALQEQGIYQPNAE